MMRNLRTRMMSTCVVLTAFSAGAGVAAAAPGGVAYLEGGHVWVSNMDGSKKVQLSSGNPWFNGVTQSMSGGVLATKNEPGKIFQISFFESWHSSGAPAHAGPLNHDAAGAAFYVAPLSLAMTSSNGLMLYGYSAQFGIVPNATFVSSYYAQPTSTVVVGPPLKATSGLTYPSLTGDGSVVGVEGSTTVAWISADKGPIGNPTSPWFAIGDYSAIGSGARIRRTSVSNSGTVVAAEIAFDDPVDDRILLANFAALGGTYVDDCWVPTVGDATGGSVSPDGTRVAWKDSQGVKVAGVPNFAAGGPAVCNVSSPPVVIAPVGKDPALGPIDVDAIWAARNPAPPTTTTPSTSTTAPTTSPSTSTFSATPPRRVTAKAVTGKTGIAVTVVTPAAGTVTVTLTIAPKQVGRTGSARIVIAKGTATARAAGNVVVRVRPTAIGKKLTAKLRGKRVTLIARIGTRTTSRLVRLS